jgi:hypothetical protein
MLEGNLEDARRVTGKLPYRLALAGGWIDQPFISSLNPQPPGSMVVVSLIPAFRFMDRCGIGTSTRRIALQNWGDEIPPGKPDELVRELYWLENRGKAEPSGSQDMAGLVYPGISRLDYSADFENGIFPIHVESCHDPKVTSWLEKTLHLLPVAPRPPGYNPLGIKNLDAEWIYRLGQSGMDCYTAILAGKTDALGASLNECMRCWEAILPNTVCHPTLEVDLIGLLNFYQDCYPGAMYSGCGGGYLIVISDQEVPGSFQIKVRL